MTAPADRRADDGSKSLLGDWYAPFKRGFSPPLTPGTPTLWVTTPLFLEQFGLQSLRELPGSGVISALSPVPRRGGPRSGADEMPADDDEADDLEAAEREPLEPEPE